MSHAAHALVLLAGVAHADTLLVPEVHPSIQAAVDAALDGDEILVGPGIYAENVTVAGKSLTLRSSTGASATVVDGGNVASVFTIEGAPDCTLEGFTIQNGWSGTDGGGVWCRGGSSAYLTGNAIRANHAERSGGGVFADGPALTLVDNTIELNTCFLDGAGAAVETAAAQLTGNLFQGNRAPGLCRGGGLWITTPNAQIAGGQFHENEAFFGAGAAIAGAGTTVEACIFTSNASRQFSFGNGYGGGLHVEADCVELHGCQFLGNLMGHGYGGGIHSSGADLVISDCEIDGNSTEWFGVYSSGPGTLVERSVISSNTGGGIRVHGSSTLRDCVIEANGSAYWEPGLDMQGGTGGLVERCSILDNSSTYAMGGVRLLSCEVELRDCVVAGNVHEGGSVSGDGAGVYVESASASIVRCTITDNVMGLLPFGPSGGGAGVHLAPSAYACRLESCIVWGNVDFASGPDEIADGSGALIVEHSDVGGGWPGVGNLDADPLFAGAPSGDFELASESPCVDAGDPTDADTGSDIGGSPRLLDGNFDGVLRVDMGALEQAAVNFSSSGDLVPGGSVTFVLDGPAGWFGLIAYSIHPAAVSIAGFGALGFDPAQPFLCLFGFFPLPASFAVTVPATLHPSGIHVLQGVGWHPGGYGQVTQVVSISVP